MEVIGVLFDSVLGLFKYEFTIYGFTFSFWEVFMFSAIMSIVAYFIGRLFSDD